MDCALKSSSLTIGEEEGGEVGGPNSAFGLGGHGRTVWLELGPWGCQQLVSGVADIRGVEVEVSSES